MDVVMVNMTHSMHVLINQVFAKRRVNQSAAQVVSFCLRTQTRMLLETDSA